MTAHRDYDILDASVFRPANEDPHDPFDMPSQPQSGESDELELVYRDLKAATGDLERLKAAAREALAALDQYRRDMQFPDLDKGQRLRRIGMATAAMNALREAV